MKTQLTTLASGLRVATCEMPQVETAAAGVWAAVGGRHEPAALNGICHFIEHMLFKGTQKRSARRIMQDVEGVGGDMNAFTAEERTCYYATAAAEHFPLLCDVLGDLYRHPRLAPRDIERERDVIAEEILMYEDEPSLHVQEMLNASFWPGHPLGRPLTGTLETIRRFQRDDLLNYRAASYHAGSTVVSAAGKVRHEDVVRRVERIFGTLPPGAPPEWSRPPRHPHRPRVVAEERDVQQTQLALGVPAAGLHDRRRYALQILTVLLGGNASSRLFQELREKRGICYSVGAHWSSFFETGMLNVAAGLDQKNLEKSLGLIREIFAEFREKPVRAAELRRAKEYAVGASRMSLERTSSQNMRIGTSVLVYGRIVDIDQTHARLRAVTAEEVQEVAKDFLDCRRATAAIIGPAPDPGKVERLLAA